MAKPPIVSSELHTAEELAQLKIRAKQRYLSAKKKTVEDDLLKKFEQEARAEDLPEEEMVSIAVDLPGHSDRIMLDGRVYFHGATYSVPRRQYDAMRDIVSLAWKHEDSVGGANTRDYRRPRNITLSPHNQGMSNAELMRF